MTVIALAAVTFTAAGASYLRVNQVGYRCDDIKAGVVMSDEPTAGLRAEISDSSGRTVAADSVVAAPGWSPLRYAARVYFTSVEKPGDYTVTVRDAGGREVARAAVYVGNDAYRRGGLHELPLTYLRQQRCGYNPAHGERCHAEDGFLVLSGDRDGEHVDVTGGWHDASDYLQYLTTSANTVYNLLMAYRENPAVWGDSHDANGDAGANGVADILDEARHGLEWMMKMNPEEGLYLNQIADDRDHRYAGLPAGDNVDYGRGAGGARPVYPCSGTPYGLKGNLNRSTGEASSVAKFASSFGLGAEVFGPLDSDFAAELERRSAAAYRHAAAHPGACQTAPCVSPYFYEEDNWVDDMELAAMARYRATGNREFAESAVNYGRMEPVTPWMGADSARHYQWYPFINLGHYELARTGEGKVRDEFVRNMRAGLSRVEERGRGNAFRNGIPFVWCSNNLAAAWVTQAMLYRRLTGDERFREAETAVRDWLMGANPWGQVMMLMPEGVVESSPLEVHSAMTDATVGGEKGRSRLLGALVDGPVYSTIFKSLRGVTLRKADRFAEFQGENAVYHDDYSDYSSNEPTMDGTASLLLMLGELAR